MDKMHALVLALPRENKIVATLVESCQVLVYKYVRVYAHALELNPLMHTILLWVSISVESLD
jgi:hypothetical protein